MKIRKFIGKDGRPWFWGTGTPKEVESLNVEKTFDSTLDTLYSMTITDNDFFDKNTAIFVDRTVYGKRKAV